jgi:hypothetical protein
MFFGGFMFAWFIVCAMLFFGFGSFTGFYFGYLIGQRVSELKRGK